MQELCAAHGYTRQAYYKRRSYSYRMRLLEAILSEYVSEIRRRQPRIGGRKLYHMIRPKLIDMNIKFGRDRFFEWLGKEGLLVRRRKKYVKTTDSRHGFRKYPNLIRDLEMTKPNQVYVADITYILTLEGFCYLFLITDAYSRKIVGYNLNRSLSIEGCIYALRMSLRQISKGTKLIHHSDRGIQYCSYDYTDLLKQNQVQISMTEQDHVYENALAERVNGILKEEFMLGETLASYTVAQQMVQEAITIYNEERPHLSLNYATPSMRHVA